MVAWDNQSSRLLVNIYYLTRDQLINQYLILISLKVWTLLLGGCIGGEDDL